MKQDMGVVTSKGILGIVENTSNKFATVQSILNVNSNINAKLKNTNHFGSLVWNEQTYNVVQLIDIPKLVLNNLVLFKIEEEEETEEQDAKIAAIAQ